MCICKHMYIHVRMSTPHEDQAAKAKLQLRDMHVHVYTCATLCAANVHVYVQDDASVSVMSPPNQAKPSPATRQSQAKPSQRQTWGKKQKAPDQDLASRASRAEQHQNMKGQAKPSRAKSRAKKNKKGTPNLHLSPGPLPNLICSSIQRIQARCKRHGHMWYFPMLHTTTCHEVCALSVSLLPCLFEAFLCAPLRLRMP